VADRSQIETVPGPAARAGMTRDRREGEGAIPVYRTEELFSGGAEIRLEHGGAEYRLKITRQGKLILNK
jgi:hemin uptake protein HemP